MTVLTIEKFDEAMLEIEKVVTPTKCFTTTTLFKLAQEG